MTDIHADDDGDDDTGGMVALIML